MLKLLLCVFSLSPVAYLMMQGDMAPALDNARVNANTSTHFDEKIKTLSTCNSASLSVFFHDDIIESHSAEYIYAATDALAACDVTSVVVNQIVADNATEDELALALRRGAELKSLLEYYYDPSYITVQTQEVQWQSSVVKTVGAKVDFTAKPGAAHTS